MGYEIAGGLGVKMAQPDRDVYVVAATAPLRAQEIVTAVQEGVTSRCCARQPAFRASRLVLVGRLRGSDAFTSDGVRRELDAELIELDFVANAASMGAHAVKAATREEIRSALAEARARQGVNVIVIPVDREQRVGGYECWWDVPVAEISPLPDVQRARSTYERSRKKVQAIP